MAKGLGPFLQSGKESVNFMTRIITPFAIGRVRPVVMSSIRDESYNLIITIMTIYYYNINVHGIIQFTNFEIIRIMSYVNSLIYLMLHVVNSVLLHKF